MNPDILDPFDIEKLVQRFYGKLCMDPLLGPYFNFNQAKAEEFNSTFVNFWVNVLFYTGKYEGNPMIVHRKLHHQMPMNKPMFSRWLELFNSTVEELFEGEKASLILIRARSIAEVMQIKILDQESQKAIPDPKDPN